MIPSESLEDHYVIVQQALSKTTAILLAKVTKYYPKQEKLFCFRNNKNKKCCYFRHSILFYFLFYFLILIFILFVNTENKALTYGLEYGQFEIVNSTATTVKFVNPFLAAPNVVFSI